MPNLESMVLVLSSASPGNAVEPKGRARRRLSRTALKTCQFVESRGKEEAFGDPFGSGEARVRDCLS